jgi:tripartite-type tricarboxylate transporter receptor subunit TctC
MAMTGVKLTHVPYRGSARAHRHDRRAGAGAVRQPAVIGRAHRGGKLRALGHHRKRSDALPDVPTVADTVPGYEASAWFGMGAPKAPARGRTRAQQGDQRSAGRPNIRCG